MQLVSIARALVAAPDILLADEPTGNVNPNIGRSIMDILRSTTRQTGTSVLMVTHNPEHAAWADRICFLKEGMIRGELLQAGVIDNVKAIHEKLVSLGI
jgi:putative ABC transport system ATP-binding protein